MKILHIDQCEQKTWTQPARKLWKKSNFSRSLHCSTYYAEMCNVHRHNTPDPATNSEFVLTFFLDNHNISMFYISPENTWMCFFRILKIHILTLKLQFILFHLYSHFQCWRYKVFIYRISLNNVLPYIMSSLE